MPTLSPPLDPVKLWLARLLRGAEPGALPDESALLQVARREGVLTLCQYHWRRSPAWAQAPATLQAELTRCVQQEVAVELARTVALRAVLAALAQAGLPVLLIKGSALAHTLYPQPYLRSRCDTDLLVPSRADAERAWQVFQTLGYQRPATVAGDLISYELGCYKTSPGGWTHALDVHWRPSNHAFFAERLTFPELAAAAVPLPALGPHAQGLGLAHALLLACIHRMGNLSVGNANRLIWLYDIHRLAQGLTDQQWQQIVILAEERALCGPCCDGLDSARQWFATTLPDAILNRLRAGADREGFDPRPFQSLWRFQWLTLRTLPTNRMRLRWLGEHLFPNAGYLRSKYGFHSSLWLPWFYAVRIVRGIFRRLTRDRRRELKITPKPPTPSQSA